MPLKDRKPSRSDARHAGVEAKVRRAVGQLRHGMPVTPAVAAGSGALGAGAIGALAIGALAIGSVAVGAFAIGRLSVGSARFGTADIGRLRIGRLELGEMARPHDPAELWSD